MTRTPALALSSLLLLLAALTTPPASAAGEDAPDGQWPLRPRPTVVHAFDPPGVAWGAGHRGVDLAGRVGEPVRAALGGTIGFAGRLAGIGVVVVDHGSTRTTYQPVSATVHRGEQVPAGAVIGRLEWPGTHCAPAACLHWGWLRGREYLDPLLLVGGGPSPVRLLPVDSPSRPGPADPGPATGGLSGRVTSEVTTGTGGGATGRVIVPLTGPPVSGWRLQSAQARGWAWR